MQARTWADLVAEYSGEDVNGLSAADYRGLVAEITRSTTPEDREAYFSTGILPRKDSEWLAVAENRRDVLYAQLDSGYAAIERLAAVEPLDEPTLQRYERAWLDIKAEYDAVVEEIRHLL